MKVRDEIEKFSDPEERADLLLVFGMYHMESEWNILSTCEFIGSFPNAKRKWRLSPIGKAVAFQHRSAEKVSLLREALKKAHEALDGAKGNINPERGFCDETEAEIRSAMDAAETALEATKEGA
jgi:hypothetical protein